jgi:hypothetical protein
MHHGADRGQILAVGQGKKRAVFFKTRQLKAQGLALRRAGNGAGDHVLEGLVHGMRPHVREADLVKCVSVMGRARVWRQ